NLGQRHRHVHVVLARIVVPRPDEGRRGSCLATFDRDADRLQRRVHVADRRVVDLRSADDRRIPRWRRRGKKRGARRRPSDSRRPVAGPPSIESYGRGAGTNTSFFRASLQGSELPAGPGGWKVQPPLSSSRVWQFSSPPGVHSPFSNVPPLLKQSIAALQPPRSPPVAQASLQSEKRSAMDVPAQTSPVAAVHTSVPTAVAMMQFRAAAVSCRAS